MANGNGKSMKDLMLGALVGALLTSGGYQVVWSGKLQGAVFQSSENAKDITTLVALVTETVKQNNQLLAYLEAEKKIAGR